MKLFILMMMAFHGFAYGSCLGENRCSSQLLRVEVDNGILANGGAENLLPALGSLAKSNFLKNKIIKKYEITPFVFPHNKETCQREKDQGNRRFQKIDCNANNLCERGVVSKSVKELICFALPCTILEGNLNEGQCSGIQNIYSEQIGFPEPLELNNIELDPTSIDFNNGRANLCFTLNKIQGKVSASLSMDTAGTQLQDDKIQVTDVSIELDKPRNVCVAADVDITSKNPVSNIVLTPEGDEPFISNNMIIDAATGAKVSGLSGYNSEDVNQVKNDLLPVLFQPLRSQVEEGVKDALAEVFEEELAILTNSLGPSDGTQALYMNSSDSIGQLNVSNTMVGNQLAITECALLKANSKPIPVNHSCLGKKDKLGNVITADSQMITGSEFVALSSLLRDTNVNSASIRDRLEALKELIQNEPYIPTSGQERIGNSETWRRMHESGKKMDISDINNAIKRIDNNILRENTISMIGITDTLNQGRSRELAMITPEICDAANPSTHAGRSIPNCSAQVYLDITEFNGILSSMWESGALCARGRGADRVKEVRDGCFMPIGNGFSCYFKSPPKMSYDSRTKRYNTAVELEKCYKGPVGGLLGDIARLVVPSLESLGSFGADFDINLSSKFKIDGQGSLEASNAASTFRIVPGTESGGLVESDRWNKDVVKGVNEAFTGALTEIIKIPVKDLTSSMLGFPIQATGKIDSGPGYIGICFEPAGKKE